MANHPRNTESPAVAELVNALRGVIPEVRGNNTGTVRNDGSRHTAGLAADIMLDSTNEYEKMIADDIIEALMAMQSQIRWHAILYTDWLPATTSGGRPAPSHFTSPAAGNLARLARKIERKGQQLGIRERIENTKGPT